MDELKLLRSVGKNLADPSSDTLDRGRRALIEHIGSQPTKKSHRGLRRTAWLSGGSALAAGVVVAALVATNVLGLAGWRGGADAAAAAALSDAAAATIRTSDPIVGTGQYLKVATEAAYLVQVQTADSESYAYLEAQDAQLYIPANYSDDWVWVRPLRPVIKVFGVGHEQDAVDTSKKGWAAEEIVRAANGGFYNGKPHDWGLDEMPRDPQQLLNYIYRTTVGQGVTPDGEAFVFIADTLRTGVVPADLRAALYRAAAGIPGVEITDEAATLDGRTGIALGRDVGNNSRQEIIIDPDTGLMIGERTVQLEDSLMVPVLAGEIIGWTAVTTTVVDSAPAGGSLCGNMGQPVNGAGSGQCRPAS